MALLLFLLGSPQIETLLLLLHTYSNSRPLTCIELVLEPTTRRDALRAFSPLATGTTRTKLTPLTSSFPAEKMQPPRTARQIDRPTTTTMTKKIFTISHTSKFSSCFILHHPQRSYAEPDDVPHPIHEFRDCGDATAPATDTAGASQRQRRR